MRAKLNRLSFLGWIPFGWYSLFLIAPLAILLATSFATRGTYGGIEWHPSFDNYTRSFEWLYFKILLQSVKLSLLTTIFCLLVGYPMAWVMATRDEKMRAFCVLLIAFPFLTNLISRVYALRLFTGHDGPLVKTLELLAVPHDPFAFSHNQYMVFYGMLANYLPFMVLPLYAGLEKFDFTLVEAAKDLGASDWQILWRVMIPNSWKLIATGCLMVFVPGLGEFVIPDLMGGAKNMLMGNLITEQFLKARDWPFGAALAVLLLMVLTLSAWLLTKSSRTGRMKGENAPR